MKALKTLKTLHITVPNRNIETVVLHLPNGDTQTVPIQTTEQQLEQYCARILSTAIASDRSFLEFINKCMVSKGLDPANSHHFEIYLEQVRNAALKIIEEMNI